MKSMKLIVAVLALFLLSTPFSSVARESGTEPVAGNRSSGTTMEGEHHGKRYVAPVGRDGIQHVLITGGSYFFEPDYIVVKANVPVELILQKEKGLVPHDIVVHAPEAGIDFKVELSDDKAKTVAFTPTKVGKYEMKCDRQLLFFKSHEDRGMKGIIEVVE